MKAQVRFADGTRKECRITNIEKYGSGEYGYTRYQGKKVPVSQSTTIHHGDGRIEKCWDEIVQVSISQPLEEDW